jgi:hypothetical protein
MLGQLKATVQKASRTRKVWPQYALSLVPALLERVLVACCLGGASTITASSSALACCLDLALQVQETQKRMIAAAASSTAPSAPGIHMIQLLLSIGMHMLNTRNAAPYDAAAAYLHAHQHMYECFAGSFDTATISQSVGALTIISCRSSTDRSTGRAQDTRNTQSL